MSSHHTTERRPGLFRRTLRDHSVGILLSWFVVMGLVAGLVSVFYVPTYRSLSILRVEPASPTIFGIETKTETFDQFLQTQIQLLRSPNVLAAAASNPKVQNLARIQQTRDVVQELKKVVDVNLLTGTQLLEISMTSPDPYEAMVIVNAVVDAYLMTNEQWANGITRKQIEKLGGYLEELDVKIEEIERRWKEVVAKGDVDNLQRVFDRKNIANEGDKDARRSITMDQYKKLSNELFRIHLDIVQAQAWADSLKADAKKVAVEPADREKIDQLIRRRFQTDPEVVDLANQVVELNAEIKRGGLADDPALQVARKKLDATNRKYNDLWEAKSTLWKEEIELTAASQPNDRELRDAETKVRELKVKEEALKKAAAELEVANQKPATDEVEVQLLIDKRESLKQMEEQVKRRLEQLRYESRGETRVRKVSDAIASNKPFSDLRPLLLWVVPLVTLVVAVGSFLLVGVIFGPRIAPSVAEPPAPKEKPTPEI